MPPFLPPFLAAIFDCLPVNERFNERVKAKPRGTLAKAPVRTQGPSPKGTAICQVQPGPSAAAKSAWRDLSLQRIELVGVEG
jgi:hypothetical protein